jgi:hypothetical protein
MQEHVWNFLLQLHALNLNFSITVYYCIFFIVAPCILVSPKFLIHQQMHCLLILENTKIYTKTYIKIAPTCFGLRPSSGGLHLSLAKVRLILKQSVKLRRYVLCGGVAACSRASTYNDVILPIVLT